MAMLKGLIIFMGILIVVGVGVIGVTIYNRATKPKVESAQVTTSVPVAPAPQAAPAAPAVSATPATQGSAPGVVFGSAALDIGQACEIAETRADANRLIVRTEGPGACRRIHIVDLATGATLGTLDVLPAR